MADLIALGLMTIAVPAIIIVGVLCQARRDRRAALAVRAGAALMRADR